MPFGFHLVAPQSCTAEEAFRKVDAVAHDLGLSSREGAEHGCPKRFYHRNDEYPELSVAFNFKPNWCEMVMFPLEQKEVFAYTPDTLVKIWSGICIHLGAVLGRTFLDIGFGAVQPVEIKGELQFLDWYQFLSKSIVSRWGTAYLRSGPFYKVEEYSNGACGIWLAHSPLDRLRRAKAAEYLGVDLPPLYGKNPKTGERIIIPW